MSSNREGVPHYHYRARSDQDLVEHPNPYDGCVANDNRIDNQNFQQLFASPDQTHPQWHQNASYYDSSLPYVFPTYETFSSSAAAGVGNNLEAYTASMNAEYGVDNANANQLSIDFGKKYIADSSLLSIVQPSPCQQIYQSQLQEEQRDEYSDTHNRPEDSIASAAPQNKPRRPALIALASSGDHSTTSTISSGSSQIESTETTANQPSPSKRKPRRGRPPLYPPLPKYEFRQYVPITEPSPSGEPSQHSASVPPLTSPESSDGAPKPRRGRPRLYSRPYSMPTSSQEITREQNRLAARRFRSRQDASMASLNARAEDLEVKNKDLKDEVARLREERLDLRSGMLEHGSCGCDFVDNYLKEETWRIRKVNDDDVEGEKDSFQEEQKDIDQQADE